MSGAGTLASSFRDPSGFVFERDGVLYRQVNQVYAEDYELLTRSGLFAELVGAGLLVASESVGLDLASAPGAVAVLRPERIPFVSYPYEWSFSQLQDAALLTLDVMAKALDRGMVLKDASAYNVQFRGGKPILIDTLSFETYREGEPWIAYRQFCQHFLAPLALMSKVDVRLSGLLRVHLDGIPLDLAARLLPGNTKLNPGLLTHLHLHAKALARPAGEAKGAVRVPKTGLLGLIDNLRGVTLGLKWSPEGTEWADYYGATNYTPESMGEKHRLVEAFLVEAAPVRKTCWDLGANDGEFSRLAAAQGYDTLAWDIDPAAVEKAYRRVRSEGETRLLPLLQDLTNPSPSLGWASRERDSLTERGPAGAVMALALIHHLAIGNNVPLPWVAEYFARLGEWAIVEFVPKDDSQVIRMLAARKDVFDGYDEAGFEAAVASRFQVVRKEAIPGTKRTLYLLRRSAA